MRYFIFSLVLIFSLSASAQAQAPRLPVNDDTKLFTYTKVVEIPNVTMGELYSRAIGWCYNYYKNPADVIRENDSIGGNIVCKARYKISNPEDKKGFASDAGVVMYTLNLQFKDGRYRYTLTDINWKQQSYYPAERWMDKASTSYQPEFDYYLQQVDEKTHEILRDLDKAMKTAPKVKKDDW